MEQLKQLKISKRMMKQCSFNQEVPYIAFVNLHNTPQEGVKYSLVQRLMGRRTKTLLPPKPQLFKPEYAQDYQENKKSKVGERSNDRRKLQPLKILDTVSRFGKSTHISMISNSVRHLRSYTNSAIAGNSAPISPVTPRDRRRLRGERRRLRIERRRLRIERRYRRIE